MHDGMPASEPSPRTPLGLFVGIFITPRQTVRAILDGGPSVGATIGLAMLGGAVSGFDNGIEHHLEEGTPLGLALGTSSAAGAVGGLIGFFLFGWMYWRRQPMGCLPRARMGPHSFDRRHRAADRHGHAGRRWAG